MNSKEWWGIQLGFGLLLLWLTVVLGVAAVIRGFLKQWWDSAFLITKIFLVALLGTVLNLGFYLVGPSWPHPMPMPAGPELSAAERFRLSPPFLFLFLLTGGNRFGLGLLLWLTVVLGVVAVIRWFLEHWWDSAFLTTKIFLVALVGTVVFIGLLEIYINVFLVFPLTHGERSLGIPIPFLVLLTGLLGAVALVRWLRHAVFKTDAAH